MTPEEFQRFQFETVSYAVDYKERVLFCRWCGQLSTEADDVRNRRCQHCNLWHDNERLVEHLKRGAPQ